MSMEHDFMVKIVRYSLNVQFSVHYHLYHNTSQTYWTTPANPELHDPESHVYNRGHIELHSTYILLHHF